MDTLTATRLIWTIYKKTLKMLAKHAPIFRLRASFLKMAGYNIGRQVYIGEDLIVVDGLETKENNLLTIGNRVSIAPRVTLILSSRPPFREPRASDLSEEGPIVIESNVWLGTGVIVMPNVTIGHGAVVGAGSVVTKNIPSMTIAAGVPAKHLGALDSPLKSKIVRVHKLKSQLAKKQ